MVSGLSIRVSSVLSFVCGVRAGSGLILPRVAAQFPQGPPLLSHSSFVVVPALRAALSVRCEVRVLARSLACGYSAPAPLFERLPCPRELPCHLC